MRTRISVKGILTTDYWHRVRTRHLLVTLFALMAGLQVSIAQPTFKWATGGYSGTLDEYVQTVATDASGNVYVAGSFEGTVDFDPGVAVVSLTATEGFDAWMAKYSSSGALTWVKKIGGSFDEEIYAIAVDASGNVYITGYFEGTVDFDPNAGTQNLTTNGVLDAFIGKYTTAGVYVWANKIGSTTGDDYGLIITTDASANVYVGGVFSGTADFDPSISTANKTSAGGADGFFAKYTTAGVYSWANAMGSTGNDGCRGLATQGSFVWYAGYYNGTMNVNPAGAPGTNASNLGGFDGFFGRYNQSDGTLSSNWGTLRSTTDDQITSIVVDATNVYTSGYFSGSATMYGFTATSTKSSAGGTDIFVARHNNSTMDLDWMYATGGTGDDGVNLMAIDGSGNAYVTGYFENSFDFDPSGLTTTVTSAGGYDAFGARITAAGALFGVGVNGSAAGDEQGTSIAVDGSSNIYLAEIYENTINMDFRGGVSNVTAAGSVDWVLARYDQVTLVSDPGGQPTAFGTSAITPTTGTVSWTAAAGPPAGYIVTRKVSSAPTNTPIDGTTYAASQTVNDFVVAYVGSSTSFGETGLTAGTTYQYKVYSYNGSGSTINYLTSSPLTGSLITSSGVPPTITSFSPVSGTVGATVTITGTGFSTTPSSNVVFFGATKATPTAATATQLTVPVPAGATYSPITVNVGGLTAYTNGSFMPTFSGNGVISSGTFATKFDVPGGGTETNHTVFQDIDLDGKPDLLLVANGNLSVYRNVSSSSTLSSASFAAKVDFTFIGGTNHIISVGDFDGDGKPDILVTANSFVSIWRNISTPGAFTTGSLATRVDISTPSAVWATIADFDMDGKSDFAVSDYNNGNVLVYRNTNSAGSITAVAFGSPLTLTAGLGPSGIASGDIDGDGKADIVVVNQSTPSISVYRNTSTSPTISFSAKVDFASAGTPQSVAIGDLNADSKLDLVTANAAGSVSYFRNQATAGSIIATSFAARVDQSAALNTLGISIADIDGDGKPDVAATNHSGGAISVFKNNGTGSLAARVDFPAGTNPVFSVAIADLDGDLRPDMAVPNNTPNLVSILQNVTPAIPTITTVNPTSGPIGTTVTISGANFSGTSSVVYFGSVRAAVSAGSPVQLTVTVPHGSTYAPISVTNSTGLTGYSARPFNVTIQGAAAISATSFSAKQDFAVGSFPDGLATGDFDLDGKPDVAVTNGNGANISIIRNISTPGTVAWSTVGALTAGTSPMGPVVADWDGDGKLDIVAVNPTSTSISIHRNTTAAVGTITFAAKFDLNALPSPRVVAVGDLDKDGKPDLAVTNINNATVAVYRNASTVGAPGLSFATAPATGSSPYGVAFADITGDGYPEMIVANGGNNTISVFPNASTPGLIQFSAKTDIATASQPQMLAIADYDGDGKLDIAVTCPAAAVVQVFRNQTTTITPSFASAVNLTAASNAVGIATDDIDGDGKPDIAAENVNTSNISVFKNNSTSGVISFGTKFDFVTGLTPHYVMSITDVDGDGKKDLLVTNSAADTYSTLRNNITVTISEPADQPTGFVASGQTTSAITVNFTAATSAPNGYIAIRATGAAPSANPVDNTAYTVGTPLGTGTVVAVGSATTFTDTGLSAGTTYHYNIYSYNGSGATSNYRITSPLQGSSTTLSNLASEPTAQPTTIVASSPTNSTLAISFTAATVAPAGYIIIRGPAGGAAPTFTPVDGTAYTIGAPVGTGNTVAYVGSGTSFEDTGLAASTTYSYRGYSFNGSGATTNYLTTSPATGTGQTNNVPPTIPAAFATVDISNSSSFYSVRFLSSSTVFAGGSGGTMLKSTDGGSSWSLVSMPSSSDIWNVFFSSATNGFAVGTGGMMARTINGGTNWTSVTTSVTEDLYATYFVPSTQVGYSVGLNGVVIKTTDGGTTWTELTSAASFTSSYYNTVYFKTITEGFVGGPDGVIRTTDGGSTWADFSSDAILWFTFPTATVGYGVGDDGLIKKTTDGGANWVTQTSGVEITLWGAHFVDANTGFAVGDEGTILKTVNGGANWNPALEGTSETIYSVHFGSNSNGVVVGGFGYIGKAELDTNPITPATSGFKSSINYGATETVSITIPTSEEDRISAVNFYSIGIVDDAEFLDATYSPTTSSVSGSNTVYSATVTSSTDPINGEKVGFKYWFEVEYDERFARIESTNYGYMYIKYVGANTLKLQNLKTTTLSAAKQSDYQLISVPVTLTNAGAASVFGPANKEEWRLFESSPSGTTTTTNKEVSSLILGKGYWFITTKSSTVDLGEGAAVNASVDNPAKLTWGAGYNLIGNPYNFNVAWEEGATVGELRSFVGGSFQPASVMEPFRGYFIDVETAGTYDIPLTGGFTGGRTKKLRIEQNESSWELPLVIEQGELRNEMGKIGMHPDASLGYDMLDDRVFLMPDFIDLASVSLNRPEAGRPLEQDYVPTTANEVWEFTLSGRGESSPVTLSWNPESIASIGRDLYLFDEESISLIDMRTTGVHQTRTNISLKIITGDPMFVKSQVTFGESRIGTLYPNPTTQGFFVPVAMPRAGDVQVKVFDMKGAEIATQLHFVEAGMQNISISGLPEGLSGLYLVTTETGEGRKVQKVIFK